LAGIREGVPEGDRGLTSSDALQGSYGRGRGCPERFLPLVLASASPRRRDILAAAGWDYEVRPADVDESMRPGETPLACCERLACDKARAVGVGLLAGLSPGRTRGGVLAGDTIVEIDGDLLGKPEDRQAAAAMLGRLSGRVHRVASSVALMDIAADQLVSGVAVSEVQFDDLDEARLTAYLDTDEWRGKAGGYAIQGHAGAFAHLCRGEMDTVIGLPMKLVLDLAASFPAGAVGEPGA
jgi:septum formation protein